MKKRGFSHFRRGAFFVAAAMIVQALFVLFLTPHGLLALFPYAVRFKSETIEDDASFAEYYELRREFANADSFFIGADTSVADSYFVILDYLRFTKRFFDIKNVALKVGESTAERINACLSAPAGELESALMEFEKGGRFTVEFLDFVRSLCALNNNLAPKRKLTVRSIYTESAESATVGRISSLIMTNWAKATGEITYAMSISKVDVFLDYFDENSEAFAEFLGEEEYTHFLEIERHYRAGDYNEWALCTKLESFVGEPTLYVVDPEIIGENGSLRDSISALGAKGAYVQIKYADCRTLTSSGVTEKNDIDLPFKGERSVRFVSGDRIDSFRNYYRFIANPSGNETKRTVADALDTFSTRDFFIVIGSPAASYKEG